jgi:hypothetical protein
MQHLWSDHFAGGNSGGGNRTAIDSNDNIVMAGTFDEPTDFGGGVLTYAGSMDAYIAKFDADGSHLWSKRFGDAGTDYISRVAVDGSDNIIVIGSFSGNIDFGGIPLTSAGDMDIFLAKFNANGTHLWSRSFGAAGTQYGYCVAVDGSDNIIVIGSYYNEVDFGGGALVSAGDRDIYLAKFDPYGTHLWSQRFGDANYQVGSAAAVDGNGNVFVTGNFEGTVDFGGGARVSAGSFDIFVAKYDANGNHVWSNRFGDAERQYSQCVTVDKWGDPVVAGFFAGTLDFGGDGIHTSAGSYDLFVARFSPQGGRQWSGSYGDESLQHTRTVAVDGSGNILLTGLFQGTLDFGGGPLVSAGSDDFYAAELGPTGDHIWSLRAGDGYIQQGDWVSVDSSGNAIVTGYFGGTVDFGGGPMTDSGGGDIFIAKFGPSATAVNAAPFAGRPLLRSYPNPFNPTTKIAYEIPEPGLVRLHVYDVRGRCVKSLVNGMTEEGTHEVLWDGRGDGGTELASGVYFVRLDFAGQTRFRKVELLK